MAAQARHDMFVGVHQVDVGIITIRQDEFEAVHCRLPPQIEIINGLREYNLCSLPTREGAPCSVALTRCLMQGTGEAQAVARDLIEDLDPQLLLVVGIAGSIPTNELTLGDVVVSTSFLDFGVEAVIADHSREYAVTGGWLHPTAAKIVANLPARTKDLGAWSSRGSIGADRPRFELRHDALYGDAPWRDRVRQTQHFHGNQDRDPIFVPGQIASSDRLVKDAEVVGTWLRVARQIRAIEMEAAGVYRAASARQIPAIAIRGISDIVGLKREDAWTGYACQSAAAFTMAFLRVGAIPPRTRMSRTPPPRPRYLDSATEKLCEQLAWAQQRKKLLLTEEQATGEVDREILQLRRELREGGQLRAGDALDDGRYLLVEKVGRGGFASVWRAFDTARNHDVAIKVLHANIAGDSHRLERFFRGARIMAELDHPSVVRVLARKCHDLGFHFFVMEYVAGGNLHDAVLQKRIARAQILAAIYAVGDALVCAHARGYVHRDVKPENILLGPDLTARLSDFDLVSAADSTGGTRTGMLGTYFYAAPEQLERPQDADARADVHSLGMTLVFALHGGPLPHRATFDRHGFIDTLDCSPGMKAILKDSIAVEPTDRIHNVEAFCLALSGLPEVRKQIAADLCTSEGWPLLAPFIRFHDRVSAPPEVATAVAVLRYYHARRLAEPASDCVETLRSHTPMLATAQFWSNYVDALYHLSQMLDEPGQRIATLLEGASVCEDRLDDRKRARVFYQAVLTVDPTNSIARTRTSIARLVVLSSNFASKEYELSRPQMVIGRTEDNDIVINHRTISHNHAKLVREPETGRYTISDLQSSNGVRVNGQDYGQVELRRGDVIDLGHVRLRFVMPDEDFVFVHDAVTTDLPDSDSSRRVMLAVVVGTLILVAILIAVIYQVSR